MRTSCSNHGTFVTSLVTLRFEACGPRTVDARANAPIAIRYDRAVDTHGRVGVCADRAVVLCAAAGCGNKWGAGGGAVRRGAVPVASAQISRKRTSRTPPSEARGRRAGAGAAASTLSRAHARASCSVSGAWARRGGGRPAGPVRPWRVPCRAAV
eukprot:5356946-Prymnesium_polylepis.1